MQYLPYLELNELEVGESVYIDGIYMHIIQDYTQSSTENWDRLRNSEGYIKKELAKRLNKKKYREYYKSWLSSNY